MFDFEEDFQVNFTDEEINEDQITEQEDIRIVCF